MRNTREPSEPESPAAIRLTRRHALAAGGLGLGALFISACGGSSETAPLSSKSGGAPKKGGTLRLSISDGSSSDSLDPGLAISTSTVVTTDSIFDQLATLSPDFAAQPALAASWGVNSEATQWTIHLRKGVKWHDGSDFTSKDVAYTLTRALDPDSGNHGSSFLTPYLSATGVSTPDSHTVVLKLTKPNGCLMQTIANLPYLAVVKDGTKKFSAQNCVGTGPFKLSQWSPGQGWKLTRNDAYWGGAPYLDGVNATITPDQSAKIQALLSASTDLIDPIPVSLWATLQGKDNAALTTIKNRSSTIFVFDQSQKPFDDPRVIQALKLATDRKRFLATAAQGHGTVVADVPVDPSTAWYPSGLTPEYDVAKAKSLLAEAGFADGLDITLSTSNAVPGMADAAQAWQQVVKDAGINVELNQLPLDTYWTKGWMATPAFMDYWTSFFPPVGFDAFYTAKSSFPETHHTDPVVEQTVSKLMSTTDLKQQIALTQQAYSAARQSYGYLIPAFADSAYASAPKVNGLVFNVQTGFNFRKTWIA
jgi:peptide/nickel transport system substrate-binding protein